MEQHYTQNTFWIGFCTAPFCASSRGVRAGARLAKGALVGGGEFLEETPGDRG